MLASAGPGAPTRLDRARDGVAQLRAAVPDVPAGISGLTDRVLPVRLPDARRRRRSPRRSRGACRPTRRRRRRSRPSRRASGRWRRSCATGSSRPAASTAPACSSPTARRARQRRGSPRSRDSAAAGSSSSGSATRGDRIYRARRRASCAGYRPGARLPRRSSGWRGSRAASAFSRGRGRRRRGGALQAAADSGPSERSGVAQTAHGSRRGSSGSRCARRRARRDPRSRRPPARLAPTSTAALRCRDWALGEEGSTVRVAPEPPDRARRRSWPRLTLGTAVGVSTSATAPAVADRRLARVRSHGRQQPLLAADRDHAAERRPARPRLHASTSSQIDPDTIARPAVVPARDRRHALRDDERRQRLRDRRRDRARSSGSTSRGTAPSSRTSASRANRGLAYCGGKLFILQLDMKVVALRPSDGEVVGELAISQDVPNATVAYGYSETSAPICANGKLDLRRRRLGARQPRVRDGVHDRPEARLADAVLDDPAGPAVVAPRRRGSSAAARSGRPSRSTPRRTRSTSAPAPGRPSTSRRCGPGNNPRAASLIAVDLATGQAEVVAAADRARPVGVRRRAAAARLQRQGRRQDAAHRLRRDEGRHLVRVRRRDREGVPRARQGDRPGRASAAEARASRSSSTRARSAASTTRRPPTTRSTNYVFNAAAETAGVLIQEKLTPTQKKRKFLLGDIFLGLENGNFGEYLPGWKDHGSISAIDVSTGRRVWKFDTPEPERGGVSRHGERARLRGRRRRRAARLRPEDGQGLWTFQTGRQIAAGPTIFSAGGKEYIAITVGGTPDLVRRRPRVAAPGVRARRQQGRVAEAARAGVGSSRGAGERSRSRAGGREPRARSTHARRPRRGARHRRSRRGAARSGSGTRTARTSSASAGKLMLGGKPVSGARDRRSTATSCRRRPAADGTLHGARRLDARAPPPGRRRRRERARSADAR